MKKQAGTATATAAAPAVQIPNFIKEGQFRRPAAAPDPSVEVRSPEPEAMRPWDVTGGSVVVYSPSLAHAGHQAVDIGAAVLEQDFEAPVGAKVEITWMHSRNTDASCPAMNQAYGAAVWLGDTQVVAHSYEPDGVGFVAIPSKLTLKFTVNSAAPYTLKFTGRTPDSCGALIYNVVGQGVGRS
ncbi:hypothetical protein ABZ816_15725 [Actinosynnema sp. NPDC047251]|uniref:Uncharacterized protein n=1 Tax=Saccharothrix espanaensis (strain ATCC 51144 / DSM 44229 / JCM 9112 / NBRC 15066 / NRRL 15764) TaxID=1179773 RepID=K0JQD1_SACES|nr:hypothetical protein [Saccharothrix espanaensis]CCH29530.1 hypothetical protein BN6_22090 [Saccharothrix espanaensis DSM 44229]